ncbi:MAG: 5'-3' exonuclease H3TH domain-containing protein, partial [Flavobacteriales bacterium]|nr:5'-3' exonuclease H3TH domain-containing protein [Flavobacteriales bacterium]
DDVIGTLAKKAEKHGYTTFMVTPDKDYGQLVSDNIFMYKPARMGNGIEILGPNEINAKYGLKRPEQLIDVLGMWGDAVDNIPGIPGVGEKTAIKFVQAYDSIEGLYEHTDELKGKMKEKVEANKDQAMLSKMLATIITDVPIDLDEDDLVMDDPNKDALAELFAELEFRTIAKKVLGQEVAVTQAPTAVPQAAKPPVSGQMDMFATAAPAGDETNEETTGYKTIKTEEHDYQLVDNAEKRSKLITHLEKVKTFCFDTETTGLDVLTAELLGIAFSTEKGKAFYVTIPEDKKEALKVCAEFQDIFSNVEKVVAAHNLKYDLSICLQYGLEIKAKLFDTMIAHYLLQPDMRHGMDIL